MQPYFFPYLGYFALIARSDRWVVFDITQYTAKSWLTRNRILHPTHGWQYVHVPIVGGPLEMRIREANLGNAVAAEQKMLGQLAHYRKRAPHFADVIALVERAFIQRGGDGLVDLNVSALAAVCQYLNVPFNYAICSKLDLSLPTQMQPGEWALEICAQLGATEYINAPGGRELFDPAAFALRGIELSFLTPPRMVYDCSPYEFIEHLSILDILMWNDPGTVRAALAL